MGEGATGTPLDVSFQVCPFTVLFADFSAPGAHRQESFQHPYCVLCEIYPLFEHFVISRVSPPLCLVQATNQNSDGNERSKLDHVRYGRDSERIDRSHKEKHCREDAEQGSYLKRL